uniref:Mos1 transposase HTH domain-containing protein n=1 Tax=Acrobeloides nanus TaxID=290746 RepID=A0A914D2L3_9BILA
MRTHNHIHLRHITLYHFEQGHTAAEAFRDLNNLFGEGTISRKTVYECDLLVRNEQNPFLNNLVTGDESWLLFKNPKRKKVCIDAGQTPKRIPKVVHCKKAMWCVWWDHIEQKWRIPDRNGKRQYNLNSDVYLAQLDRLQAAIEAKRQRKKNHIVFHHDNARPHVEGRVVQSITDKGWDLLPHPPYSPTDYHVNRSVKNWQSGKFFDDFYELVANIKEWVASKKRDFFARGIDRLPAKWEAVCEVDGEYTPE